MVVKKDLAGGCINGTVDQFHLPVLQGVNSHCPVRRRIIVCLVSTAYISGVAGGGWATITGGLVGFNIASTFDILFCHLIELVSYTHHRIGS